MERLLKPREEEEEEEEEKKAPHEPETNRGWRHHKILWIKLNKLEREAGPWRCGWVSLHCSSTTSYHSHSLPTTTTMSLYQVLCNISLYSHTTMFLYQFVNNVFLPATTTLCSSTPDVVSVSLLGVSEPWSPHHHSGIYFIALYLYTSFSGLMNKKFGLWKHTDIQ